METWMVPLPKKVRSSRVKESVQGRWMAQIFTANTRVTLKDAEQGDAAPVDNEGNKKHVDDERNHDLYFVPVSHIS